MTKVNSIREIETFSLSETPCQPRPIHHIQLQIHGLAELTKPRTPVVRRICISSVQFARAIGHELLMSTAIVGVFLVLFCVSAALAVLVGLTLPALVASASRRLRLLPGLLLLLDALLLPRSLLLLLLDILLLASSLLLLLLDVLLLAGLLLLPGLLLLLLLPDILLLASSLLLLLLDILLLASSLLLLLLDVLLLPGLPLLL